MDEDNVTKTAADVGVDGSSSPPKENNTASTFLSSALNVTAALSAPNSNASGGLNASMHARTMTPASPPKASPDKATADNPPVNLLPVQTPTFSIERMIFKLRLLPT
ncbi:hypothetical protein RclHR1_04200025 [Rhizophagus clarus]|uniref:Uncharacterized protein n=1 Tax=Rhizophagus clarus TaxID=94130 RepID=A0A2Z6SA29_9GLOM|nr:hypothetical protein RclHR1_04200025 [Rhizophagus clarus]GES97369.1 hypothetical protein GLOIN_2v1762049 [Rhizophagus clarus]